MEGTKLFNAYLIHSLPLEMSAIQLFVGDRMATVAHLVGPDTLGDLERNLGLCNEVRRGSEQSRHKYTIHS